VLFSFVKFALTSFRRQILQDAQSNPKALQDHMKNPQIAKKIQKLINSRSNSAARFKADKQAVSSRPDRPTIHGDS
jgi:hypothetical protein